MSATTAQALAGVVAESPAMRELVPLVQRLAETRSPVLLEGESGTGKDLVAHWLHYGGARREGPFIKVHCPSIPGELLESELFGHEKGAFTDARQAKAGKIEMAAAGTLYFDQIQDLVPPLQAKLLRVIEERHFERVGGTRTLEVDVRFVASANVDLAEAVRAGRFREDLFHRLNVVPLKLEPLRNRREDVLPLARAFLARERERGTTAASGFAPEAGELLRGYHWPGNVRELRSLVERIALAVPAGEIAARGAASRDRRAARDAVGRPRAPPHAAGRRARLHPLRARGDRRQPDARGRSARHLTQGALGEETPLRDRLGEGRTHGPEEGEGVPGEAAAEEAGDPGGLQQEQELREGGRRRGDPGHRRQGRELLHQGVPVQPVQHRARHCCSRWTRRSPASRRAASACAPRARTR